MDKTMRDSLIKSNDECEAVYKSLVNQEYDYEMNNYTLDKEEIDYLEKFPDTIVPTLYKCEKTNLFKKNLVKSLVSKSKIRFTNNEFDLDLIYITERLIGMGYPSVSCESLYRNSLKETKRFFKTYHNNKIKIYNLCLEPERLYHKRRFEEMKVGLFPTFDHSACPIKILLAFCVDICIYLLSDKENTAAVHCKAGKGRTGTMICAYLVFSSLCENVTDALEIYADRRSYKRRGVTIQSQRRYLYHFETYLSCNFTKPYYKLIPKITKDFLPYSTNLLINFFKDKSFNEFINIFNLKKIKIGPIQDKQLFSFKIINFKKHVKFDSSNRYEKTNFKYTVKEEFNHFTGKTVNYSVLVSLNLYEF